MTVVLIWPVLRLEMNRATNHRSEHQSGNEPKKDDSKNIGKSDSHKVQLIRFFILIFLSLQTVYKYSLVHLVQFIKRNLKS